MLAVGIDEDGEVLGVEMEELTPAAPGRPARFQLPGLPQARRAAGSHAASDSSCTGTKSCVSNRRFSPVRATSSTCRSLRSPGVHGQRSSSRHEMSGVYGAPRR